MNTSTKLELLRRSVGPWYVAVFSSFQMFFLLVCCHHFLWIQVLIFWRSMVRCYGQHLIMEITQYILKNSVVHSLCFTSGLQSAVHRLNFTLTDILAFCKPGCHSWEATPAPKMTLIKDLKSFPLPIASGIHRYKNPSVLYNFYSNLIEHLRLCIHPGVVNW